MDSIKGTLFINQLVSKPIQPAVLVKDSVPSTTVGMKDCQTSTSGKFCNIHITLKRGTLKYLKCSVFILLTFFFANLIESFDIHKANVIIGIHVLKKEIGTSIRTRNF